MPQQARSVEAAKRRATALELRSKGYDFRRIARETGVSLKQAYDDVWRAIDELPKGDVEKARREALERLDHLQSTLSQRMAELDEVQIEEDGTETWFIGEIEKTAAAILRVEERRARLLGLDAPIKAEVQHSNIQITVTNSDGV